MIETYTSNETNIRKEIRLRDGSVVTTSLPLTSSIGPLPDTFDKEWLMLTQRPLLDTPKETMKLVDLFCGTGPMTLGVVEAGRCLGIDIIPTFAIDFNMDAANNYKLNFPDCRVENDDIHNFLDGEIGDPITKKEMLLKEQLGDISIAIGGPPCQGFSDLNNHTRRDDPRNQLIFRMVRFAELFRPQFLIIENVQGISHDKHDVLGFAKQSLEKLGYHLQEFLLMASKYGVAQNRRRFLLVASLRQKKIDLSPYEIEKPRSVLWAIGDLMKLKGADIFNTSAIHSVDNQNRIDYLFQHGLYELPNHLRPKCQQKEDNRYTSVYGRMYPDKPAPTITSGFGSVGQGRFCHPSLPRTLTPHEAARVQFIPDFFVFDSKLKRVALQKMIGNAVPPKLTYLLALELLR